MTTITSFEIKYETAANVPPPYCYYYHIRSSVTPKGMLMDFQWVYHNREGITQDELEEEGFTGNDDFAWKGSVSRNWLPPIEKLLKQSHPTKADDDEQIPFLELQFQQEGGQSFQGMPDTILEWEYFLQEFIQCIYETSGKEAPLLIRYKKVAKDTTLFCSIRMHFNDRTVSVQTRTGDAKLVQKTAQWEKMKEGLEQIFSLSYIAEKAEKREPHQEGIYLDVGENAWYEFGKTVLNPSVKIDTLAQVSHFFDKLTTTK